ncbi:hypothetical protein B0J12DRAFT_145169 [Macrophomina phaseolina]|uniref:Uncharacterized protein n=1 Tax=Macrophomina phaseolina TaxID=35725 RepID=A0ABQ8G6Y1_9PEZI|nr:hypothetical protein B0J12DRAFT_145169 [Macrophomina phaseolina]
MCFVLIGCWPCGHMKPLRTRFCDHAEPLLLPLQHSLSSSPPPPPPQATREPRHGAWQTPFFPASVPCPTPGDLAPPSSAGVAGVGGGGSGNGAGTGQTTIAPCPKGVNQYEHDPHKACPVCGREPADVLLLQVGTGGGASSSSHAVGARAEGDGGAREGSLGSHGGVERGSSSLGSSVDDGLLAAQTFGDLEGGSSNAWLGMEAERQLLTPPAEGMETVMEGVANTDGTAVDVAAGCGSLDDAVDFGAGADADANAQLFAWCLRDLPASSCGV